MSKEKDYRENKPAELAQYEVVKDIRDLKDVDVAILATPTRSCEEYANQILPLGINTVDSFDIHTQIRGYRERLMKLNKETNTVSVIAAGWDPGSDSIVRTLMQSLAPKGLSYTNFGPGMSMGHSVCVRSKEGVKNALSNHQYVLDVSTPHCTQIHIPQCLSYTVLTSALDKICIQT